MLSLREYLGWTARKSRLGHFDVGDGDGKLGVWGGQWAGLGLGSHDG